MGKIDLRPMTLGEVLDRTFKLYKENFWLFAGIVALPYLILVIFSVVYSSLLLGPGLTGAGPGQTVEMLGEAAASMLLYGLIYLLVFASAQAATVAAVSDLYLGREVRLSQAYVRVRGRILTVLLTMFLVVLLSLSPVLLAAIFVPLLMRNRAFAVLTLPLMVAILVLSIMMLCRTALAVPAATLEDVGADGAIGRSFRLTKGSAAQIFAVYVLLLFLTFLAMLIFQFPFLAAEGSLLKPHALSLAMRVLQGVSSWVSGVIVAPIGTIAFALIYYNQRVRKEAFDLEKLIASTEPGDTPTAAFPA
jgi:hypothetical protein